MMWGCGDVGSQSAQGGETDSSVVKALQLLTGEIRELRSELSGKVDSVAAGLGDVRRFQGTMVEMVTLMNLPARLKGCRRVRFEVDADLDAVFGRGTAAAVLGAVAHPSGGRMLRTRLLRRLLLAVRRDLDDGISLPLQSSGKGAAAVQAVLDTLPPVPAARLAAFKTQLSQAARKQSPDIPGVRLALLVLFLLATGRLRAELEVDLIRLRPRNMGTPLFGRPELLVGEIKSDLSELGPARRQLEIALAVLELACRFSPYCGGGGVLRSLLAPYSRWRPPSLDARAVVCGVLDGKALAARQGLLGDLQGEVEAQSEDEAAAVMMHVPLEVFWFDGSGT
eukprot:XP_001702902.1 predicted protein [Chlamydomonas reinhardtii]